MSCLNPAMATFRSLLLSTACLAIVSTAAGAQLAHQPWQPRSWKAGLQESRPAWEITQDELSPAHRNPLVLAAGGVVGYAATRVAIQALGAIATRRDCDGCLLGMAAVPLFLAIPTLTPLGVHLANGRQGDFGVDWLASTAVAIGVGLVGARQGASYETLMIAVPVSSILAAVATEILTTPRRPAVPGR